MPRYLRLNPGDQIDVRLGEWMRKNGYSLYWDAPKFQAGGSLVLDKPVEAVLQDIVAVMRGNGLNIEVEIYENNAVRVLEVK